MTFVQEFGPALMGLDTVGMDAPTTETIVLTREVEGYSLTPAGYDILENAVDAGLIIVPDEQISDDEQGEAPAPNPGEVSGEAGPFTPDTKPKADWVLEKIADLRARAARIREHGEAMAREHDREAEHLEWKYGAALQDLARRELEGARKKSLTLYHGVIGFRTKPAGVAITDDVAALSWARENCPAVVVERLDKKALGDALKGAGEVVPFAQFTPAEEVFYIR